jgi:hypothetical protein
MTTTLGAKRAATSDPDVRPLPSPLSHQRVPRFSSPPRDVLFVCLFCLGMYRGETWSCLCAWSLFLDSVQLLARIRIRSGLSVEVICNRQGLGSVAMW